MLPPLAPQAAADWGQHKASTSVAQKDCALLKLSRSFFDVWLCNKCRLLQIVSVSWGSPQTLAWTIFIEPERGLRKRTTKKLFGHMRILGYLIRYYGKIGLKTAVKMIRLSKKHLNKCSSGGLEEMSLIKVYWSPTVTAGVCTYSQPIWMLLFWTFWLFDFNILLPLFISKVADAIIKPLLAIYKFVTNLVVVVFAV